MPKERPSALARAIARAKRSLQTAAQDLREVEQVAAQNQGKTPGVAGDQVATAGDSGSTPRRSVAPGSKAA